MSLKLKEMYWVSGNVIENAVGERFLIVGERALCEDGFLNKHDYNYNLTMSNIYGYEFDNYNIVKVYKVLFAGILSKVLDEKHLELIWERDTLPKISEQDYHILKGLDEKWTQIAYDDFNADKALYVYDKEEVSTDNRYYNSYGECEELDSYIYGDVFKTITFESGVLQIKELIKKYEEENRK